MKNKIDIIILSKVVDENTFLTTKNCIESYIKSANELINKIFVIETNKDFDKSYGQSKVELIIPNEEFNYNRFFNIALEKCEAEFIFGPNNDLSIHDNCLQTIIKEFNDNLNIHSISPIDRNWHRHTKMYFPTDNKIYYGYGTSLHMFGCAFCCRRSIFEKIGYLDEQFYFFYQDNDYIMCLERCGLIHGIHTGAQISHKSGHTNYVADERFKYTPYNMNSQGNILFKKWNSEPFISGGYKPYKIYNK